MKLLNYDQSRYFADDVGFDRPSLNSGIAQMLIDPECTPKHAWAKHPMLGGAAEPDDDQTDAEVAEPAEEDKSKNKLVFDIGHAIHRAILGRGATTVYCEYDSWRSKAAQSEKAAIRSEGKTPLLAKYQPKIDAITSSARLYMASEGLPPMDEWETEVVYTGETRHGWPTRCMVDARRHRQRLDLKSAANLSDRSIQKAMYEGGYAFQDEFYQRITAQNGDEADERFILFIDKSPPYCHRLVRADPFGQSIIQRMVDRAEEVWDECMRNGFRAWPDGVSDITPPDWWVKAKGEYV